jgi:predicted nucleic acid-binding protein
VGTVSGAAVLFDTNILIDHLNGEGRATQEIGRSPGAAISIITWIEVMSGAAKPEEEALLRGFLANFQCLPITGAVAERAAENRRVRRIKLPDAIILATAETSGRQLVSRNLRDFSKGMRGVRVPYQV